MNNTSSGTLKSPGLFIAHERIPPEGLFFPEFDATVPLEQSPERFAVIYARYSSHKQNDKSIEDQIAENLHFAKANNIQVVGIYFDRAKTGRNSKARSDFQRMLADADSELFDLAIVWDVARFGRNREEIVLNKRKLRLAGIGFEAITQPTIPGAGGVLMQGMNEVLAEYYSVNLAEGVRRGMTANAKQCKVNGGPRPFGLTAGPDKTYIHDPETAPIVQELFVLYDQGWTFADLNKMLNERGIKTNQKHPFTKSVLRKVLSNRKYIGEYKHGDVIVPGGIPALIDNELFERVQVRLELTQKNIATHQKRNKYMLAGKIFCAHCGGMYKATGGTSSTGKSYYYYRCENHTSKTMPCDGRSFRQDELDDLVIDKTLTDILSPENIELIADRMMATIESSGPSSYLLALEAEIKENKTALKNLTKAIEQGIITKTTQKRLMELEDEADALALAYKKEQIKKPRPTRDAVVWFLNRFKNQDYSDNNAREKLIRDLVNSVIVHDDMITIVYNYTQSPSTPDLDSRSLVTSMVSHGRLERPTP